MSLVKFSLKYFYAASQKKFHYVNSSSLVTSQSPFSSRKKTILAEKSSRKEAQQQSSRNEDIIFSLRGSGFRQTARVRISVDWGGGHLSLVDDVNPDGGLKEQTKLM